MHTTLTRNQTTSWLRSWLWIPFHSKRTFSFTGLCQLTQDALSCCYVSSSSNACPRCPSLHQRSFHVLLCFLLFPISCPASDQHCDKLICESHQYCSITSSNNRRRCSICSNPSVVFGFKSEQGSDSCCPSRSWLRLPTWSKWRLRPMPNYVGCFIKTNLQNCSVPRRKCLCSPNREGAVGISSATVFKVRRMW